MRQISLFLVFLAAHIVRIPFDPNPHHDGLMYTAAVASSRGLVTHRDFFSQYGPLTPFVHGLWFNVAPNTILSLRFFNALLLSLSAFLIFQILKLKTGSKSAFLIALIWSASSPEILPAGLPWPTVVSSFILLITIYSAEHSKKDLSASAIYLLGGMIALSTFTRLHNLSIPVLVVIFGLLTKQYRVIRDFTLGYVGVISCAAVLLHSNSALSPYIQQSIVWPLSGHAGSTYGTRALIINALLLLQFPFFAGLLWLASKLPLKNCFFLCAFFVFVLFSAYSYSRRIPEIPTADRSFAKFEYLSSFIAQQTLQMMMYGLMAICVFLMIKTTFRNTLLTKNRIIVMSVSLGSLFQLYPSPDAYHIWWIAPLLFVALPKESVSSIRDFIKLPLLVAILIVNVFHNAQVISVDRSRYQSSVYSGMYGNEIEVDKALVAIQSRVGQRSAHFECSDGVFAANTHGYLANDVLYVNWPKRVNNSSTFARSFLIDCAPSKELVEHESSVIWSNSVITIRRVNED
jgi:hypothetical protein